MVLSAKFCRQCGNLLDPSEMTTRSLDAPTEPPSYDHQTRPANAGITAPTYTPMMMQPQPPAPIYGSAPPSNNKTVLIVILSLVMVGLIGVGVIAFIVFARFSGGHVPPPPRPPVVTEQRPPAVDPPRPPNLPPPPPHGSVKSSLDSSLIYPGAEVITEVASDKGGVTQLQAKAAFDKVVDWYVEKIKPKNQVTIPGGMILNTEAINVLITSTGDTTSIMVTRKNAGDQ